MLTQKPNTKQQEKKYSSGVSHAIAVYFLAWMVYINYILLGILA